MAFTPSTSDSTSSRPSWRALLAQSSQARSTPAGQETSGTPPSPAWQAPESVLAGIEPEAQPWLQRIFDQTLEAIKDEQALPPARRRLTPQPFLMQHLARPRFQDAEPGEQDQAGLDRLLHQAVWRSVDALEAAALLAAGEVYAPLLAEQCAQIGRVYREIKQRGGAWVALLILQGELRWLHHRGSAAVERLLFG